MSKRPSPAAKPTGPAEPAERARPTEPAAGGDGSRGAVDRPAPRWLLALGGLLAVLAFRDLLSFESAASASRELEDWFFAASDSSPLVVLSLSLWLLYRRWDRLRGLSDRQVLARAATWGWLAAALLAMAAGVLGWATLTGATDLVAVALLFAGGGLATLWKGPSALRVVWPSGLLLLFAIPVPPALFNVVVYDFQLWTGQWAGTLLGWIGMPAFVSGDLILRPEDTFSIIEGCSGMRTVETLTMLSILLVEVLERRGFHALALVVIAPLMAFAMNGFRVLTLIFNPHSEIAAIHNLQGVVVLLCGLAGLLLVDLLIDRVRPRPCKDGAAVVPDPSGNPRGALVVSPNSAAIGVAALLACAVISLLIPQFRPGVRVGVGLQSLFEAGIGEWQGSRLQTDRTFLGSVWFSEELHARYRRADDAVDIFIGLGDRRRRATTFLSPKTRLPGSGWTVVDEGQLKGTAGEWQLLRARARSVLVYSWTHGTDGVQGETLRSLLALDSSPFHLATEGMAVRIGTDLSGPRFTGLESARRRLDGFRSELEGALKPLRSASGKEAVSPFSLSGKSCSVLLVLGHLQNPDKTGSCSIPRDGTPLAI